MISVSLKAATDSVGFSLKPFQYKTIRSCFDTIWFRVISISYEEMFQYDYALSHYDSEPFWYLIQSFWYDTVRFKAVLIKLDIEASWYNIIQSHFSMIWIKALYTIWSRFDTIWITADSIHYDSESVWYNMIQSSCDTLRFTVSLIQYDSVLIPYIMIRYVVIQLVWYTMIQSQFNTLICIWYVYDSESSQSK